MSPWVNAKAKIGQFIFLSATGVSPWESSYPGFVGEVMEWLCSGKFIYN
jgi:hypothetical protein